MLYSEKLQQRRFVNEFKNKCREKGMTVYTFWHRYIMGLTYLSFTNLLHSDRYFTHTLDELINRFIDGMEQMPKYRSTVHFVRRKDDQISESEEPAIPQENES